MPWLALPFKDARVKPAAKFFQVRSLPRLIVLNAKTGATINDNAVGIITEQGPVILEEWINSTE